VEFVGLTVMYIRHCLSMETPWREESEWRSNVLTTSCHRFQAPHTTLKCRNLMDSQVTIDQGQRHATLCGFALTPAKVLNMYNYP